MTRYWVAVASRDHVLHAVRGGFFQANHGREAPLKRLARGDRVVFYSPRSAMRSGAMLQAFTAVGEVVDEAPHRAVQTETFQPFRRHVRYFESQDASIRPILATLSLSRGKRSWGRVFMRGFLEIEAADYVVIAVAMKIRGASERAE